MDPEEYGRMERLERTHWWFRGKREAVGALLARAGLAEPGSGQVTVDVGCGTGAVLERFGGGSVAIGIDDHWEALRYAVEKPGARLARSDARALPFDDDSVDRIFLLDVAEHVAEDERVFAEVRRVLKPEGAAIIHVPAHPALWSPHDEAVHHVRRYTRGELERRLHEAGLRPLVLTYTFAGILLPAIAVRAWKRRRPGEQRVDFDVSPGWMNRALHRWQRIEAGWLERRNLPFGLSLGAVARPEGVR